MRAKRAKQYRKLMNAYALSFGFRPPLQVLLDADVIRAASRFKMKLGSMLESTLGGYEIKPMITQCCIRHLYDAPVTNDAEKREKQTWIEVAQQAERRRCGHHELETPLTASECLESVVDPKGNGLNKHRYVVASQDPEIRANMRSIAGVPIVYINRSVMILEPMSASTGQARQAEEKSKIRAGLKTRRGAEAGIKRKRDGEDQDDRKYSGDGGENGRVPKRTKIKGPKGPNPLSVKKSKKSKPVGKENEAERSVNRKTADGDDHAAGIVSAHDETDEKGTVKTDVDGPKKRKRKRKPKEASDLAGLDATREINSE